MAKGEADYGYVTIAAPVDAWRAYDENDPDPGYFEFDSLSARFPDLYRGFASTCIAIEELVPAIDGNAAIPDPLGSGQITRLSHRDSLCHEDPRR